MSLHFMPGVRMELLKPQTVLAMVVASECYGEHHEDAILTCVDRPGEFAKQGYHSKGQAIDLATRRLDGSFIPVEVMDEIVKKLRDRIGREGGGQYDVVDERKPGSSANWTGSHIHIEYDPK